MLDIEGLILNESDIRRINHPLTGGVILFSRNYQNINQLNKLIVSIRSIRNNLLIAVDHEGGRVQRFHDPFTKIPSMRRLGEIWDRDQKTAKNNANLIGWLIAKELGSCDIDFSFTPVLDIDFGESSVIKDRAFHQDTEAIIELSGNLVKGLFDAGMQAVAKHFPGHGYIKADSHLQKVIDDRDLDTIQSTDILPFKALINKGISGIMPSHVIYTSCDSVPASFSKFWLQDQLRHQLNFDGVIFSDDMSMKAAVNKEQDILCRVKSALLAGCDMVLVCNSPNEVDYLLENLKWVPTPESLRKIISMKLDVFKNKISTYQKSDLEGIRTIITNI
jgi:beta-N-acetylhexosaminidase